MQARPHNALHSSCNIKFYSLLIDNPLEEPREPLATVFESKLYVSCNLNNAAMAPSTSSFAGNWYLFIEMFAIRSARQ